jgi:hypothetical protein
MADEKKSEEVSEDELDQIIADMSKEEEAPAPAPVKILKTAKTAPSAPKGNSEQSLSMQLTGVINLKLNFASGDRSIELTCTEEALLCRMADGTEFRIPTGVEKKRNAA